MTEQQETVVEGASLRVNEILAQYFVKNLSTDLKLSSSKDQDEIGKRSETVNSKKSHKKHKKNKKKKKKHSHHHHKNSEVDESNSGYRKHKCKSKNRNDDHDKLNDCEFDYSGKCVHRSAKCRSKSKEKNKSSKRKKRDENSPKLKLSRENLDEKNKRELEMPDLKDAEIKKLRLSDSTEDYSQSKVVFVNTAVSEPRENLLKELSFKNESKGNSMEDTMFSKEQFDSAKHSPKRTFNEILAPGLSIDSLNNGQLPEYERKDSNCISATVSEEIKLLPVAAVEKKLIESVSGADPPTDVQEETESREHSKLFLKEGSKLLFDSDVPFNETVILKEKDFAREQDSNILMNQEGSEGALEEGEISCSEENEEPKLDKISKEITEPICDKKRAKKHKKKKKKQLKSKDHNRSRSHSAENRHREIGHQHSKTNRRTSPSPRRHHLSHRHANSRSSSPKCYSRKRPLCDLREKIDKKRLLEIARKNVLTMIEKGTLPNSVSLQNIAQQQLVNLKAGGKSVEELTEFCKGLVHDTFSDSSEDDRKRKSISDEEDSPFIKHPFKLKEHVAPIRMNIPNGVQLPVRSPADTAKLRQIFPVSSGNQHRIKELEWVPVEKTEAAPTKKSCKEAPKQPCPSLEEVAEVVTPTVTFLPVSGVKPSNLSQSGVENVVSDIVAKRLSAVRKLQENPLDMQALSLMYQAQQQMQEWATSKIQPGQFGIGPETRLLTPQELSGPTQVWAKKNQLTNAAPVSGGVGMNLLRKMGWNPGEGLGKNKEGSLVPLMLDVKVDKRGLVSTADVGSNVAKPVPVKIRQDLSGKHPVSALMELCSKRKWGPPEYSLLDEGGPSHRKNFLFRVRVKGVEYQPSVSSPNKKQAKALAAQVCLQTLGLLPRNLNSAT